MPETEREQHDRIQQTVVELLQGVPDPDRVHTLIAAVIARHAPVLAEWAEAQFQVRHGAGRASLPSSTGVPGSPEAGYAALFGVSPVIARNDGNTAENAIVEAHSKGLRVDPELARLAIVLQSVPQFRLWIIARELVRQSGGAGKVSKAHLEQTFRSYCSLTTRHLRRLLVAGEGLFWNSSETALYIRSSRYVSQRLATQAHERGLGRLATNRPGARDMYVTLDGSLERVEASLYAAWLAYRNNPTISRSELQHLFNRDKTTLRRWERSLGAGLTTRHNFAHCPDVETFFDYIPREYALPYLAFIRFKNRVRAVQRIRWQLPNTYQVGGVREHAKRGQAGKVRRAVNYCLDMPASLGEAGLHRLYVEDPKTIRRLNRDAQEPNPLFLWRGEDFEGRGVFEINANGYPQTYATERR